MNPTGEVPQQVSELIFLRFQQPFLPTVGALFGVPPTWLVVPLIVFLLAAIATTIVSIGWRRSHRALVKAGRASRRDPAGDWLGFGAAAMWVLFALTLLTALFVNDTFGETVSSASGITVATQTDRMLWLALTIGVFVFATAYAIAMYVRDTRTIRWFWAAALASLRITVYAVLCFAFLLPAVQTFEKTEKRSHVVVLLDITPSVTQKSDEIAANLKRKPMTRIETVIEFLTDDKVSFLKRLMEKNPVVVYRFGNKLDEEAQTFGTGDQPWAKAEWEAFTAYDFKPLLLKGLTAEAQEAVKNSRPWEGAKPGTPDWAEGYFKIARADATPSGLSEADTAKFQANWEALAARVSLARTIVQGTNVPDSVSALVNRESGNMVQGIIIFSDGRSNLGSGGYREIRARAAKEKIPLFTIGVGEDRETATITINGIQSPDIAPPDEPFKLIVDADGVNLANQPTEVFLDLFMPGKDSKTDEPDTTLTMTVPFSPGDPPHLQAEFVIDPAKFPEALTEPSKDAATERRQLKQGPWTARARIARNELEATADAEHVFERPKILILQKKLKVLLVASTPSREYQALRTLLVREVQEDRAELSILLQGPLESITPDVNPKDTKRKQKDALKGIVQDVDQDRLLVRFPNRLEVGDPKLVAPDWEAGDSDYKYYNLNEYDVIIAIDADWEKLTPEGAENLRQWVEKQGGGLIFVAGPLKTDQLARIEAETGGKNAYLAAILDILPVIPDDIAVMKGRATPKNYRRLYLTPPVGSDLLRLDDAKKDDPIAGWEQYFNDEDTYTPNDDPLKEFYPHRGFYSVYPIKTKRSPNPRLAEQYELKPNGLKPKATLLAEFASIDEKQQKLIEPWLVVLDPVAARGRSAYLASGEIYRMQGFERSYYERFWMKLIKYMGGTRNVKAARGRVLLDKEYVTGAPIRIQAQLLDPKSRPYPVTNAAPRFRIIEVSPTGTMKNIGEYHEMTARKTAGEFDGYYTGQIHADPRVFQGDEYRYRVVIDVPESAGDTLDGEFKVKPSDPERDNQRPDFTSLLALASDLDKDFEARITDDDAKRKLTEQLPKLDGSTKLAFELNKPELLGYIPDCMTVQEKTDKVLGKTDDIWDRGFAVPQRWTSWWFTDPQTLSYLLLLIVGLLSMEWMGRKLLRLA